MKSMYEHIIRLHVKKIADLLAKFQFTCNIDEQSWQEYSVKLMFLEKNEQIGHARLYYAPSKKSFRIDARYIHNEDILGLIGTSTPKSASEKIKKHSETYSNHIGLSAYVDGSYIKGKIGFGCVILLDNDKVFEDKGTVSNPEYQDSRQVAGELTAVGKVIQWCITHNHSSITIYYDYAGIEAWVIGTWRAKQPLTQRYAAFVKNSGITVYWKKVAAHTGNYWNEYVDDLAKKGTQ